MSNFVTASSLKATLSKFLDNLISWLPIKGFTEGGKSKADTLTVQNPGEVAMGYNNESNSDTLMSVGNGTETTKSNAFEVKKDGSIYIIKDNSPVKLQDSFLDADDIESISESEINNLK